jgi:hypothetical protein
VNGFYKDAIATPLERVNEAACVHVAKQLEMHVAVMRDAKPDYAGPLEDLQATLSAPAFEQSVTAALGIEKVRVVINDVCRSVIPEWDPGASPFAAMGWQRLHTHIEHPDPISAKLFVDAIRLYGQQSVFFEYTRHHTRLLEIAKRELKAHIKDVKIAGHSRDAFVDLILRVGLAKLDCVVPVTRTDYMRWLDRSVFSHFVSQFADTLREQSVHGSGCQLRMRDNLVTFFNQSRDAMKTAVFDAAISAHTQIIKRDIETITRTLNRDLVALLQTFRRNATDHELESSRGSARASPRRRRGSCGR